MPHRWCQGEAPPRGGCTELQMHKGQQADDAGNGYVDTKICYGACTYA